MLLLAVQRKDHVVLCETRWDRELRSVDKDSVRCRRGENGDGMRVEFILNVRSSVNKSVLV